MDIRFQNGSGGGWRADCVLTFAFEKDAPQEYAPELWEQAPWLHISPALRDFSGKKDETGLLYGHPDAPVSRVLICGLGKKDNFDAGVFRNAVAGGVQTCKAKGYAVIGLCVEALDKLVRLSAAKNREELVVEAVAAAKLCLYRAEGYRSEPAEADAGSPPDPRAFDLLFTEQHTPDPAHRAARQGEAEASGVKLARDLGNGPANHVSPEVLAEQAQKLAKAHGFACTVFDGQAIRDKGMGALWAVARGATAEPRFIVLEHCPKGRENDRPVVIAGKGITFDSGGVSLKSAAKMWEMKSDMGGAAAVLGLFAAIGDLPDADELPRLVGLIPATENMPDGDATRPGDVVTTLSGKTVEIMNTDAEGRLVVCDALTYAQQQWNPAVLVDIATLTGACVIALGDYGTGLFTQDKTLRRALMDAARETGDLLWPLPLWDEYDANLKSDVADMSNIGPREGGAINAALFLRRFVAKETRWVHLDIAGPGWVAKPSALSPVVGATGMGVRLLCRLLRNGGALDAPSDAPGSVDARNDTKVMQGPADGAGATPS